MSDGACDFTDDRHQRNWMITRIDPPHTLELCDEHLAPGLIPILASELGLEFDVLYAGIEKIVKREAAKAEKALALAEAADAAGETVITGDTIADEHQADDGDDLSEFEETGLLHGTGEEAL